MKNRANIKDMFLKSLSLGVGLAISFVLIAKVAFEMSWDSEVEEVENVYAIRPVFQYIGQEPIEYKQIPGAVAPGFKQYIPGVESATRTTFFYENERFQTEDGNVFKSKFVIADTSYFKVFPTEILAGDPVEVLGTPGMLMVSRSFAEKITGKGCYNELVGHTLCNEDRLDLKLPVGGVFEDFPQNSCVANKNIVCSMESYSKRSTDNWVGNDRYKGWVRLEKGADPDAMAEAIQDMVNKNLPFPLEKLAERGIEKNTYRLVPLRKVHLEEPVVRNGVIIMSIIAFLLIIISVMNCILITVSAIVRRSKEVGVMKCMGAGKGNIYGMLFGETAVSLLLAVLIAALFIFIFRPFFENILGLPLTALLIPQTGWITGLVLLAVLMLTAVVPGYLYSRIPVSVMVKKYDASKKRWKLALLLVQFIINVVLVVLVLVIMSQHHKSIKSDMGYSYENVLYLKAYTAGADDHKVESCLDELRKFPEVLHVARSYGMPILGSSGDNVYDPDGTTVLFNFADQYEVTEEFFDVMDIKIIEGRIPETSSEMVISRSMVEKLDEYEYEEWKDGLIGKALTVTGHEGPMTVTGIYEDYMIGSVEDPDGRPSVLCAGNYFPYILLKVQSVTPELIDKITELVNGMFPDRLTEVLPYSFLVEESYKNNQRTIWTIWAGVLFSLLIAFFGLIGYVRDESQRRSKEMAVRKINGASESEILKIFIADILKILAVAIILGDILVWFVADYWLQQFATRVSLSAGYFLLGDLIVVLLVVATVALCARKISRANPVESLKDE